MRLIDADALIERLQEYADNDWNKSLGGIFIDCIDVCIDYVENAPTAYDISKVVAELEERAEEHWKLAFSMDSKNFCNIADKLYGKQVECLEIIDIVRKGGVE